MIGSAYFTIEDAIAQGSGNITLAGDVTSATTYVTTSFTSIKGYYNNNNNIYNINRRTLLVPYTNDTNLNSSKNVGGSLKNNVYAALIIPEHITINIQNSSSLIVGGAIASQTVVGQRGVVMNEGIINIASGSSIESYGYIKGSGRINMASGSSAVDCMSVYDWPGGTAAAGMITKVFPTNAWSMHNISCNTYINSGAKYDAYIYVYTSLFTIDTKVTILGVSSTNYCLFKPSDSSGYILKTAVPANSWLQTNPNYNALNTITGSNQIKGQKDVISLYGNYNDATLEIDVGFMGIKMKTSTSLACPLGYVDVIVSEDSTITLSKADYLFFPGTTFTVNEGATVNIEQNVNVTFADWATFNSDQTSNRSFYNYCIDQYDAKFVVNGIVNVKGYVGGKITSSKAGGILNISSGTASSSYKALNSTESDYVVNNDNLPAKGHISSVDETLDNFSSTAYVSIASGSDYYWDLATNGKKFTIEFYDGSSKIYSKEVYTFGTDTYEVSGSEYIPTKDFYEFKEWLTESGSSATGFTTTTTTIKLYASWEKETYQFEYIAGYNGNIITEENGLVYTDKMESFTIDNIINDKLSITTKASYNSKSSNYWYIGTSATGTPVSSLTKSQLIALIEIYGDEPIPLYCEFTDVIKITIIDEKASGLISGDSITVLLDEQGKSLNDLNKAISIDVESYNYDFSAQEYVIGYDYQGTTYSLDEINNTIFTESMTFTVKWSAKEKINVTLNNALVTITYAEKTTESIIIDKSGSSVYVIPNSPINFTAEYTESTSRSIKIDNSSFTNPYTVSKEITVTATSSPACLVEGTLLTMADGTQKKIEDINIGEEVLVFDHEKGTMNYSKIIAIGHSDQDAETYEIVNLVFSNKTTVRIVYEHGFYNSSLNEYIHIDASNYSDFIGDYFYNESGKVQLVEGYITHEKVRIYAPVTAYYINCFAEGFLTWPAVSNGNFFKFDESMKYDEEQMKEDINLYGLYSYEDFKDYIPYDVYCLFPFKYYKIAVGKGQITFEEIIALVNDYIV